MTCEKADNGFDYSTDSKCYGCAKENLICLYIDIIKLHIPGLFLTAERCIFSTVNFCLIDLNVSASCSKRMTSLHNFSFESDLVRSVRFAMLVKLHGRDAGRDRHSSCPKIVGKNILARFETGV